MRIGIIGAGNVGTGIGRRLAIAAHDIVVGFARTPEALQTAVAAIGGGARGGSTLDAAEHGEVVILATPWPVTLEAVAPLAAALAGKVVWDCTNPLKADMSGLALGTTTSGGEEIALALPGAQCVKAIPPFAELLHATSTDLGGRLPGVFVCGDDAAARAIVAGLVAEIGAEAIETGPLALARCTEPLGLLLVHLAYVEGLGPRIGAGLLRAQAPTETLP